jgi:hypothetical protein
MMLLLLFCQNKMRYSSNKDTNSPVFIKHRFENGVIYAFFYQNQPDGQRVMADEYALTPDQLRDLAFEMLRIYENLGFANKKDGSAGFY